MIATLFSTAAYSGDGVYTDNLSVKNILRNGDERIGESVLTFNTLFKQDNIASCDAIPTSGSGTVDLGSSGPGYTFTLTYETAQNYIPTGLPSEGDKYDKRIVLKKTGETNPIAVFELSCSSGGGYALSTMNSGQLMEQHWNDGDTNKYRNIYLAEYMPQSLWNSNVFNDGSATNTRQRSTLIEYRNLNGATTINATCVNWAGTGCLYEDNGNNDSPNSTLYAFTVGSMQSDGTLASSTIGSLLTNATSSHPYMSSVNDYTWWQILNYSNSSVSDGQSHAVSWDADTDGEYHFDEEN